MTYKQEKHHGVDSEPHLKPLQNSGVDYELHDEPALNPTLVEPDRKKPEESIVEEPALKTADIPQEVIIRYVEDIKRWTTPASYLVSWSVTGLICLVSGLFAVLATLMLTISGQIPAASLTAVIVFAPIIEELAKSAPLLMTMEYRPALFRNRVQILLCGLMSGLVFASIENLLYIHVYVSDPSPMLIHWRWTVCVAMHTGCTLIASMGGCRRWLNVRRNHPKAFYQANLPYLITAIAIHGTYNLIAIFLNDRF